MKIWIFSIIGIIYFYILFLFIPKYNKKSGIDTQKGYYKKCIIEFLVYIIACILYFYFYDWLEGFFK